MFEFCAICGIKKCEVCLFLCCSQRVHVIRSVFVSSPPSGQGTVLTTYTCLIIVSFVCGIDFARGVFFFPPFF
jgi:hypothetical protein